MGFWSSIYEWFIGFFSTKSRLGEEEKEYKIEKKEAELTKKEEKLVKNENKLIKDIIKKLSNIHKEISKSRIASSRIKVGLSFVTIDQSLAVLIHELKFLIETDVSIKEEESKVDNMRNYWAITRRGLLSFLPKEKNTGKIDNSFRKLGIELKIDEEYSEEKIKFVKEQYKLIRHELGGGI